MTVSEVREKWNRRYQEKFAGRSAEMPDPNPLAMRFRERVSGGILLDAACGLGTGIAALIDRVERVIAVDLSDEALRAAQAAWEHRRNIEWIQADVSRMGWPSGFFDVICAFGFTDWDFLERVPDWIKPGGLFLYQGFSRRQMSVKPTLDPAWTSTPEDIAALFPGWEALALEETNQAPFRVSFAAIRPDPKQESHR